MSVDYFKINVNATEGMFLMNLKCHNSETQLQFDLTAVKSLAHTC
jgi:hypothetical protein